MLYKLNNVTNLSAARWAAAEGFDYISFNFDKSNINYIQPMEVLNICKWVPGLKFIGDFSKVDFSYINEIHQMLLLDGLEIDFETVKNLENSHSKIFIKSTQENINEVMNFVNISKMDCVINFQKESKILASYPLEKWFIPSNAKQFIINNIPLGVNFDSANEIEPGLLDFEELNNALECWKV